MMENKTKQGSHDGSKKILLVGLMVCILLFMVSFSSAIISDYVSYWELDETSGTIVGDENNNNNLTNIGTATVNSPGKIGTAYDFDGTNDYLINTTIPTSVENNDYTYNAWIKLNVDNVRQTIISIGDSSTGDQTFFVDATSNLSMGTYHTVSSGENIFTNSILSTGNWYMVTVTRKSTGNLTIYLNGTNVLSTPVSNPVAVYGTPEIVIGARATNHADKFNGIIDEIRIWNRSLSQAEVTDLYGGIDETFFVSLTSPSNESILSNKIINFTGTFNITGTNADNYTWKNTTLYVWDSDGIEFDTNYTILTDNNTITTLTISDFTIGDYEWNYVAWYGNDTYSNYTTSSNNNTFEWRPFEIDSQDYNEYVYETDNQRFNLSITTLPDILSVTSKLNYNGSEYTGITSCTAGDCDIYSAIDIPLITTGESLNYSFYWTITVYDGTSSYSFDTIENTSIQNVTRIHLEKCAGVYTTETVNFTAYMEDNLTQISPFKIQGTFNSWLGSGDVKRTSSFNEASVASLNLCLTPVTRTQFTDALIEYSFNDENITYVPRNYNFQNASFTNVSNEIRLYLLEAEDSTSFIIKVQDQKLSGVSDALVYIQKYYPEDGEFRTVQIAKTDSNGETIGFYEVETVDYRHIIIKNGEVLLQTTQQKVVGKSVPYTLTFTVGDALGYPWSIFEKDTNIQSTLTYNKTSMIVTFTYIDVTGGTTLGNLIVYSLSYSNSTGSIICDVDSIQSSATLTCNMTDYDGNFVAYGYIESEPSDILNFLIATGREIFGREGLLIGVFIIMVAGLAFIWNPTAGIVSMNAAVILTNLIGFMVVSPVFIFAMIAVSFIAIILLKT